MTSSSKQPLLRKLCDGEVFPSEQINPAYPEYIKIVRALGEEKEYFRASLTGEARERFDRLDKLHLESSGAYAYENFAYGFRLGVELMIETLAPGRQS